MNGTKPVEIKPYLRGTEELIAGLWNGQVNMTAKEYHGVRDGIMNMRKADPAMGALYDKYLTDVVQGGKSLPTEQMNKLQDALRKQNVGLSTLVNDVGMDLKKHGWSTSYRPPVCVSVNGRPMHPDVVVAELKASGVAIDGDIPRSTSPGKISNGTITVKKEGLIQGLENVAQDVRRVEDVERKFAKVGTVMAEVVEHSGGMSSLLRLGKTLPFIGKLVSAFTLAAGASAVMAAPADQKLDKAADEVIDFVDPTGGILTKGVPLAIQDIKQNGAQRKAEAQVAAFNMRVNEAEKFLLSAEHPGQLGSLPLKSVNGVPLDVAKMLRDPDGQKMVLAEIAKREAGATTPESKELFKEMHAAADEFIALESRRKPVPPVAVAQNDATPTIVTKPQQIPALAT